MIGGTDPGSSGQSVDASTLHALSVTKKRQRTDRGRGVHRGIDVQRRLATRDDADGGTNGLDRVQGHAVGAAEDRLDGCLGQARYEPGQEQPHGLIGERFEAEPGEVARRRTPEGSYRYARMKW